MQQQELSDRARHLLRVLVEKYISDGQPVGSRTLSRESGLVLSAATIRNVMADLEELGLVVSPHTSAGRVPTAKGFRFFVDSLVALKPPDRLDVERMRQRLHGDPGSKEMVETASQVLSEMTRMAGLVMVPRRARFALRHVEFLPLSERRILAILVVNEREVQNRVIQTERQYSVGELQQAANYLNEHFCGRDILAIRDALVADLDEAQDSMNRLMLTTIDIARSAFRPAEAGDDYVISGETRLMQLHELADIDKLRQLFEAFQRKRQLLGLLDRCLQADGLHIFIGEEAGEGVFGECSMVTSTYSVDGQVVGVLGVVGPTRMDYERVIPVVDVTAKLLGAALNSG
ncbi:MAG TPA: heat-inducible transcriptional repressor HrcA [Gammaproteobacteria bacterium]